MPYFIYKGHHICGEGVHKFSIKEESMNEKHEATLRDFLYINTKRTEWEKVIKKYEKHPEAQGLKLTRNGDTALHLAVLDNREEMVQKLVNRIKDSKRDELLETTNDRKENPLHLAAQMGSATMCYAIASAHHKLVEKRNKIDETPLYLAAASGNRDAFFCLYHFCRDLDSGITANCRLSSNGDTVLHSALRNDHFDLAFHILHLHNEAMHWVTKDGVTPLHVLASKPTAFKSGSQIRGWRNIAYYCTHVDQLNPQPIDSLIRDWIDRMSNPNTSTPCFPANYETCIDFFTWVWDGFLKGSGLKRICHDFKNDESKKDTDDAGRNIMVEGGESSEAAEPHQRLDTQLLKAHGLAKEASITNVPRNYNTCIHFFQIVFSAILISLGWGSAEFKKIRRQKEKHTWSVQVMEKLLEYAAPDEYDCNGGIPMDSTSQTPDQAGVTLPYSFQDDDVLFSVHIESKPTEAEKPKPKDFQAPETPMLLAAKNGVIEIVKGMFCRFPLSIYDAGKDKKNVVLLAAEYGQPDVYRFLLSPKVYKENLFRAVDDNGNSALHLAAAASKSMIWRITGAALQMQWEIKWYKFVEESVPLYFFAHYNKEGKNATAIFHETHMDLVQKSGDWLIKTSKSCSVVGALIVTVAFTSVASIPGGFNPRDGSPFLQDREAFFTFALFSLIALCLSSTSVTIFLAILTHRFDANDFRTNLPWKLFIGFSSLFGSIISMLISFCAGHYFLMHRHIPHHAALLYTIVLVPVALIFIISKLPLYIDVVQAIFKIVPKRSAHVVLSDPLPLHTPSVKPFRKGKFEVTSTAMEDSDAFSPSTPLSILAPTAQGSYPLLFFLPGCAAEYDYSHFLQRIASQGLVIVCPLQATRSEANETSQFKTWDAADREMVEERLSGVVAELKGGKTKSWSLALGYDRPWNPLSGVIGLEPVPGTKFRIRESEIQTYLDHQPSNISGGPVVESQLVVSKLCGTVKQLVSEESSS
ncbi:uncharacterized protein LOC111437338 isoform X3 [Cucurbita moschata]|uniref:Uncharacterized protein LOC111437338 isoform X3 n=1 Tax=Cucurbita moschata TaxID=3662 RepID=A0A6J1ET45_CUCMO|nr:uncharacterized protein LOC111437338 isoform X3 [Cucurbita moschata]